MVLLKTQFWDMMLRHWMSSLLHFKVVWCPQVVNLLALLYCEDEAPLSFKMSETL